MFNLQILFATKISIINKQICHVGISSAIVLFKHQKKFVVVLTAYCGITAFCIGSRG